MYGQLRGRDASQGRAVVEALEAVKYLEGVGHTDPVVLPYYRVARVNPYQALLYKKVWEHGIAPVPLLGIGDLDDLLPLLADGVRTVLHLHWTATVLVSARDEESAQQLMSRFLARLDRFIDAGGQLVWSVHNVLPHDCRFPLWEARLQQEIVDRCSVVHILAERTPAIVAEWFTIPEDRTLHVPLPNYLGVYSDIIGRVQARYELAVEADELTYSFLGALNPYKGLDALLGAFSQVASRPGPRRRLLVAGAPGREPEVQDFLRRCLLDSRVTLRSERIPADDMQLYLRASDIAVLPYERSLNSAVLMLVLSFGLPVVAPEEGSTAEIVTPEFARTFTPGDQDSLVAAMEAADELRTPAARAAAFETARRHDPDLLSERFATELLARLPQRG